MSNFPIIQPVVEGEGEVASVPILLRRLATEMQVHFVEIAKPIRRSRCKITNANDMTTVVGYAKRLNNCGAVFYLFDADDTCPKQDAIRLQNLAAGLAYPLLSPLVLANKEYEAWFLADLPSYNADPDHKRGAKEELENQLGIHYNEIVDQPKYTNKMDLKKVYIRSRSFQKLVKEYFNMLKSLGYKPSQWSKN